jgi:uncharacterized protein YfdQ (DUF2303 family)
MDKSAIEQIQLAKQIEQANVAIGSQSIVALPDNFNIKNLEQFEPLRQRFRGTMLTKSVGAFADYTKAYNTEFARCFIDADEMKASVIFNMGNDENPGHCDNAAAVTLERTAPYAALNKIINSHQSQKAIAEFIEDWRDFITCYGEEDENGQRPTIKLPKALHAIRSIKIEAKAVNQSDDRDFGASKSTMESIDVKSDNMPPSIIEFTCNPYNELKPRSFQLRVGVLTNQTPTIVLRLIKAELHQEQMAEEFKAVIENHLLQLDPLIPTFIGTFNK